MRPGIVVTAREGSLRLPGKHLMELDGEPMLGVLLRRLSGFQVTVATTPGSYRIYQLTHEYGAEGFFDSAIDDDDVSLRVAKAGAVYDPIILVHGDSPWVDARMLREALELFERDGLDLLWNTSPSGFRWRIGRRRVFEAATAPREHVLKAFTDVLPLRARSVTHWLTSVKFSIDTKEDLAFANEIAEAIGVEAPADDVIAEGIRRRPHLRETDATGHAPVDPVADIPA